MKKWICLITIVLLMVISGSVLAEEETVKATQTGFTNVYFDNGYHGYCIDNKKEGAYINKEYTEAKDTSVANNNITNEDISQELKIMFTQGFELMFVDDGNGSYKLNPDLANYTIPYAIYHFTGEQQSVWGTMEKLTNVAKTYNGDPIPDHGYVRTLENGDKITFHFIVLQTGNEIDQDFFAYKIETVKAGAHTHEYTKEGFDETNHWDECDCGEKTNIGEHKGGEATCKEPAKCEDCGKTYGTTAAEKHTGQIELRNQKEATTEEPGYTGDKHCKDCGVLLEKGTEIPKLHKHEYNLPKSDEESHWNECECGDKSAVEKHTFGEEWKKNDDGHWHECECGVKKDIAEHNMVQKSDSENHWEECVCGKASTPEKHHGGEATCIKKAECKDCGEEYGQVNKDNHKGDTVIKNAKEPKEFEEGYTGDKHCKDCDALIEKGEVIPATHKHDFNTPKHDDKNHWNECKCGEKDGVVAHEFEQKTNEEKHWDECDCGQKVNEEKHHGGEATCIKEAKCEGCGEEYGQVNKDNHKGDTVIKNAKEPKEFEEGYTGDTHCKDCDALIEKGEVIPATHKHDFNKPNHDEKNHWNECKCGEKEKVEPHDFKENSDDKKHWEECECGEKIDVEKHDFEEKRDKDNHWEECECGKKDCVEPHEFDIPRFDEESHWKECECGETTAPEPHFGGEATCIEEPVCEGCGEEYGEVDPDNHTGETELRNAKEPTPSEPGYSGDKHCKDCGGLLQPGTEIPQLENKNDENTPPLDESPKMGDNFQPGVWLTLILMSLGGCIAAARGRKKNAA